MSDDPLWTIFVNASLINNFVLAYFLGICPFLGVSGKLETATRMGGAVMFVMLVSSICAYGINQLLVALGRAGKRVVRLKSGDPLVFGRAGEELQALRDAGLAHEVVPGVTAALAAAADFGMPLTLRGVASSLVFTTGHDLKGETLPDWAGLAIGGATVAVYMGRSVAADVAARLIAAGLSRDTQLR